ncbi:MAG: RNA methyltransferase [Myxococcota bacterium]
MGVERVHDLSDPRLADFRNVRDPALVRERHAFVVESRFVVRALLSQSTFRTRALLVTETALAGIDDLLPALDDDTPVFVATGGAINEVAGFHIHQGCLAIGERRSPPTPSELLESLPNASRLVVLENVTNPDNVGAVFRNALAFGAGAVLLDAPSADPLYRKAIRTAMGASLRVPYARAESAGEILEALADAGFVRVALTPDPDALDLVDWATSDAAHGRVALLLGNEGEGLAASTLAGADARVRIVMPGDIDSLNVGTASAIALYELCRSKGTGTFDLP